MSYVTCRADELTGGSVVVTAEDGREYEVASVHNLGDQMQIRYLDGYVEHAPPAAPYDVLPGFPNPNKQERR